MANMDKVPDMEMEMTNSHSPPEMEDKRHGFFSRQGFVKDETVLARFGKRQQLRVRVSVTVVIAMIDILNDVFREASVSFQRLVSQVL